MRQIRNFGFMPHVQEPHVPDTPQQGSRYRQYKRLAKGDEPAVCHP